MEARRVTIHCSDSQNGKAISIDEFKKWHLSLGFKDIGYHFIIQPNGQTVKGRPLSLQGAHVKGHNKDNIGVCLVGRNAYTRSQFSSLRKLIDRLLESYPKIKPWMIYCHYQYDSAVAQGKTCPNMEISNLLHWYYTNSDESIGGHICELVS